MKKSEVSFDSVSSILEKKRLLKFTHASSILDNMEKVPLLMEAAHTGSETVSV